MEFNNNDIIHILERPPSRDNLSIYNVLQIVLIICLGCSGGYNLYSLFKQFDYSFVNLLEIVFNTLLFIGACISILGLIMNNNAYLKGGFIIFGLGCLIAIIKIIVDWVKGYFNFYEFLEILFAIILLYIIITENNAIKPLASPYSRATTLKYGDVNTETPPLSRPKC